MPKRVLCKFFAHGACLKGEHCEFSHDWKPPPNNICTFYQKGVCAYGSRCRYEHVKVSVAQATAPSSQDVSGTVVCRASIASDSVTNDSASSRPLFSSMRSSLKGNLGHHDIPDDDYGAECISKVDRVNQPICSFASVGDCPHGEKCPFVHDEVRPICGKQCLHHLWPQEREQHMQTCDKRQKQALKKSHEIECSVCLELVLSKPTLGERKFGILPECDHPFCISCIRNWRNSSPESGLDVNSALRACPICRKISYFVVPSVIWYFSKEEKQEIIDHYKAKLRSIDCKYFDFGNGSCPFGTSCFYKHAYHDGFLEAVVLHHLGAESGNRVLAKNITSLFPPANFRLPTFFRNMQIM